MNRMQREIQIKTKISKLNKKIECKRGRKKRMQRENGRLRDQIGCVWFREWRRVGLYKKRKNN